MEFRNWGKYYPTTVRIEFLMSNKQDSSSNFIRLQRLISGAKTKNLSQGLKKWQQMKVLRDMCAQSIMYKRSYRWLSMRSQNVCAAFISVRVLHHTSFQRNLGPISWRFESGFRIIFCHTWKREGLKKSSFSCFLLWVAWLLSHRSWREKFSTMTLLPDWISCHQPINMGIISTYMHNCRYFLLQKLVLDIATRQSQQEEISFCRLERKAARKVLALICLTWHMLSRIAGILSLKSASLGTV